MAGPTAEEVELLKEQRDLTLELVRLLKEQTESVNALHSAYMGQTQVTQQLTEVVNEHGNAVSDMADENERLGQGMQQAADSTETLGQRMSKVFNKSNIPGIQGLANATAQFGDNISMVIDVISNPLQAAMGFLSTFFDAVMELAVKRTEDMLHFREALEQVRKEFGSFNEATSARIKRTYDSFGKNLREAAGGAGVFSSKFNMGIDGSIEKLKEMQELAGDMGPVLDALGNQFDNSTVQLYVMKNALGFSAEAIKNVGVMSIATNKSQKQLANDILANTNKIATGLGLSSKVLGKDISAYMGNFKNLGKMTGDYTKEIIKAAAYTRKLGIELAELTGLTDKFDDFEQGAEAAAQLAAGFGMVLDPIKLMQAQNPADVLSQLQKAFAATGRSFESLSRQDKALLTSQSGLTEQQAALAFSAQGLSMSYDQIKTQAEGATKQHKTQEEVMRDLADSIENVITPFEQFEGFLDAFKKGFKRAFETSGPLQKTVSQLAGALMDTYHAGFKTFGALLKIPGVNAAFKGLLEIVRSVGSVFSGIADQVEKFVSMMSKDPKKAATNLVTGITDVITNGFGNLFGTGGSDSIVSKMLDGIGQTFMAVIAALPGLLIGLVRSLKTVMKTLITTMRGAFTSPSGGGPTIGNALMDAVKDGLNTLLTELPSLLPILFEFGTELVSFIAKAVQKFPITSLFVVGGPILTVAGDIFNKLVDTVTGLFGGSGAQEAIEGAAETVEQTVSAQQQVTNSLTQMGANTEGSDFSKLVDRFGGAAEKAADWAALAFGITVIGGSIINLVRAITEPPAGQSMSVIDLVAQAAVTLTGVNEAGLNAAFMFVGGILAAAMAGVGGMILAMGSVSTGALVGGAVVTFLTGGMLDTLINLILPRIGEMVKSIVDYLGGEAFKTSIENIKTLSKTITEKDTEAMSNLSGIFTTIGSMVGGVLAISKQVNDIPALTVVDESGFVRMETDNEKLSRVIGYVSQIIGSKSAGTGMMGVIGQIESQFAGADINLLSAKFTAFSTIITPLSNAMVSLMKPGIEFASMIKDFVAAGDTSVPQNMITSVTNFIRGIGSAAVDITMEINDRINLSKDEVDSLMGKTAVISAMGKMIGDFASGMVTLSKTMDDLSKVDVNQDAIAHMREMLFGESTYSGGATSSDSGLLPIMQQVMDEMGRFTGGVDPKAKVDPLKRLKDIFSSDGVLAGVINSVSEMAGVGVQKVIDSYWFLSSLAGIGGNREMSLAFALNNAVSSFSLLSTEPRVLAGLEKKMQSSFNVIGSYISGMETIPEGAKDRTDAAYTRLIGIRDTMKSTADLLDKIDIPHLDAKIDDFNKKLTVTKSRFEVNGGAVVIHVNLGVSLSAQKMAETLVMEGMVAPNPEFGEYLQSSPTVRKNQYDYFNTEYTPGSAPTARTTARTADMAKQGAH